MYCTEYIVGYSYITNSLLLYIIRYPDNNNHDKKPATPFFAIIIIDVIIVKTLVNKGYLSLSNKASMI